MEWISVAQCFWHRFTEESNFWTVYFPPFIFIVNFHFHQHIINLIQFPFSSHACCLFTYFPTVYIQVDHDTNWVVKEMFNLILQLAWFIIYISPFLSISILIRFTWWGRCKTLLPNQTIRLKYHLGVRLIYYPFPRPCHNHFYSYLKWFHWSRGNR